MTDRHGVSETVHENRASLHRASAKRRLERRRSVLSCSDSEELERISDPCPGALWPVGH
jgi:hypothetical protein